MTGLIAPYMVPLSRYASNEGGNLTGLI
jgi:hypothetical protein